MKTRRVLRPWVIAVWDWVGPLLLVALIVAVFFCLPLFGGAK